MARKKVSIARARLYAPDFTWSQKGLYWLQAVKEKEGFTLRLDVTGGTQKVVGGIYLDTPWGGGKEIVVVADTSGSNVVKKLQEHYEKLQHVFSF